MADNLKSAFLANMSHEIQTPLNAIVGFSSLISESDDAEERKKYYNIVNSNNERLLQLINEILDPSKIESGIIEFSFKSGREYYRIYKKGSISYGYKLTDTPIIFHVTDIGIGIEPEKVERIFERFTKLNNYAQGTGLGLSICKSIIERPGGKISVSSEFGKGSKFIGKDA